MDIALSVARKCIVVSWKSDSPLPISGWSLEINAGIPLQKITYSVRKQYDTFLKVWQPYLDHMGASSVPNP